MFPAACAVPRGLGKACGAALSTAELLQDKHCGMSTSDGGNLTQVTGLLLDQLLTQQF